MTLSDNLQHKTRFLGDFIKKFCIIRALSQMGVAMNLLLKIILVALIIVILGSAAVVSVYFIGLFIAIIVLAFVIIGAVRIFAQINSFLGKRED